MMTSGVLVMAKRQVAAGPLAGQFRFAPVDIAFATKTSLPSIAYLKTRVHAACHTQSSFAILALAHK